MQLILVILSVAAAVIYLGAMVYRKLLVKKDKCEGCALHKLHSERL